MIGPDRARVAGFLTGAGANIVDAQQFDDRLNGRFFMRVVFEIAGSDRASGLRAAFTLLADVPGAECTPRSADERQRMLLTVSKFRYIFGCGSRMHQMMVMKAVGA